MGLDLNLGLKTAARYAHLGYFSHIFDPKKIVLIYFPFYAIFRPIYTILRVFYGYFKGIFIFFKSTILKYTILGTCKKIFW